MKNLFILIAFVFLSCKDKAAPTKNESVLIAISDAKEVIGASNAEIIFEEEFEHNNIEIASNKVDTTSEENNSNQDYMKSVVYKGTLNNNIKISLYLKEQENSCGGDLTFFTGMYKYDNQNKWILLDITTDRQNKNYCMVEDGFSGVLFLEENEGNFSGNWISTDTKKQFKVELENQLLDTKFAKDHTVIEELDEILFDDLIYNKNDC